MSITNSDSFKRCIKKVVISIFFIIMIYVVTTLFICSNSWSKIGLYYQGFGLVLLAFPVLIKVPFDLQWCWGYFKQYLVPIFEFLLPALGLSFAFVGLILQF